ncbi:MAG TPA: hypothetical protein VEB22_01135 [Phycisphaerales bacterium]|nr:hypothetical protein [Phycisphaerales bacterium]
MTTVAKAAAALLVACTSTAFADVVIQSRFSELRHSFSNRAPFPPSYSHTVSTTAMGPVTLTTPSGESFASSVTSQAITAQLRGLSSSDGFGGDTATSRQTRLEVVFQVTDLPAQVTIVLNGQSFPAGNASFLLRNDATSQTLFHSDSNAVITGFIPEARWTSATWSGTLAPGVYRVIGIANGAMTYSHGGGSGSDGGGSLNVNMTLTPAPGAAALLALAALPSLRRRR